MCPNDARKEYAYLNILKNGLSVRTVKLTCSNGNSRGNLNFIWKIPSASSDVDIHTLSRQVIENCKREIPSFHTHDTVLGLYSKYSHVAPTTKHPAMKSMGKVIVLYGSKLDYPVKFLTESASYVIQCHKIMAITKNSRMSLEVRLLKTTSHHCRSDYREKRIPSLQHARNNNMMVQCECGMWHIVYSKYKLTDTELEIIKSILDNYSYTCGIYLVLQ